MKIKNNFLVIVAALFLILSGTVNADSFGAQVGSFNGVAAYSNGNVSYYSGQKSTYNGYNTGIKWQCVEFVSRFFKAVRNKQIAGGNANTFYSNASSKGLNRSPNGGTDKPQVGNLICSNGGSYGHCGIIREVTSNSVKVIHQNYSNNSSDNSKTLTLSVRSSGGKTYYTVGSFSSTYPVVGWMW